jgi:hypothetical protein
MLNSQNALSLFLNARRATFPGSLHAVSIHNIY